jgi:hypothetical protein
VAKSSTLSQARWGRMGSDSGTEHTRPRWPILAVILGMFVGAVLLFPSAAAPQSTFFECADFTPASVAEACNRAVPIECRGPDAPPDFDQCLRDHGTTPEAVSAAIEAAQRAAGIPTGGVDTGFGGLTNRDTQPPAPLLVAAVLALVVAVVTATRRASRS